MKGATIAFATLVALTSTGSAQAQHDHHGQSRDSAQMIGAADAAMNGSLSDDAKKHLVMSPMRPATAADSARASELARTLRAALEKYADTAVAVADGYRMFAPQVKNQRVYHFTNYGHAFMEAFRFDAGKPTSILYRRGANGRLELLGAMYTAPKRWDAAKLDERVPLSIGMWHRHVNWCIPGRGEQARWLERRNGKPVFGPESPIATREQCRDVGGRFFANPMGWMIHLNVFAGERLGEIFAHEH